MSFSGQSYLYKINGLVNAFVEIVNDYIFEGTQNNISKINSSINKVIRWKKPLKAFQAATSCRLQIGLILHGASSFFPAFSEQPN